MPETPPSSILSEEEKSLRIDINRGIKRALDKEFPNRDREITETEREKLIYFIANDLDYDLTYSWYLAGACSPDTGSHNHDIGPEPSQNSFGDIQTQRANARVDEIKNYLINEEFFSGYKLEHIWYANRSEFLSDFYEECAPDRYSNLYLASQSLRSHLGEIDDFVLDDRQLGFGDFGINDQPVVAPSDEQSLREAISRFHIELAKTENLDRTQNAVIQATDLIEQVYLRLTNLTTIDSKQREFIEGLSDFFYYFIWKYPALIISTQTATGPSAEKLKINRIKTLENFEEILTGEIDTREEKADSLNLLPTSEDIMSGEIKNKIYIEQE